ncbi:P-loop ATPase, Sll1717 family [Levilactobacillus brevis]|uniref:P-loop ATPase, Sll1717 family n=1 Tax=Levilactobacillus brevis TaxID=1580 RepID=UPI0021A45BE5|nr:hypothetical protein [Levilactobacillus brevis]MCT3581859.1 hypothetical protein [Levilactobacillus brevis]
MTKVKFSDIPVGYEDADVEVEYSQNLKNGFYDFNDYLPRLKSLDSPTSILIGRKGVGKTAYLCKISMSFPKTSKIISLSETPYYKFPKMKANSTKGVKGGLRYLDIWRLLLITEVARIITPDYLESGKAQLDELCSILNQLGLLQGLTLKQNVSEITNKGFSAKIHGVGFEIGSSKQQTYASIDTLTDLSTYLLELISTLKLTAPFFLLVDGVDDILQTSATESDVLASYIRVLKELNMLFKRNGISFKIITAIREDIVNSINDPDLNKVIASTAIHLNWYTGDENVNLVNLMNKRLSLSEPLKQYMKTYPEDSLALWFHFFPEDVISKKKMTSWSYFLEHTLYRPRDVIHFLNQVKENYSLQESIGFGDYRNELSSFSQKFFFEEMKNELAGFVDKPLIDDIEKVFPKLGKSGFNYRTFVDSFIQVDHSLKESAIQSLLYRLFNDGYIGQRLNMNSSYVFKHKNPRAKLLLDNQLVFHRGLYGAMNISE